MREGRNGRRTSGSPDCGIAAALMRPMVAARAKRIVEGYIVREKRT